ncbi:hypothetical protein PN462_22790 [Spirulina sp. CS-785/01]|uniref:hypothetical protein n=1 Tax=Spirulina sp. CS-785/01 TaxID=3021716 RepID=UPI00232DC367|nr:hypothetical protein [Spirulina sp. CS-785/01]MDB9315958.1 hypothetical protein [Spirulina sp. CS-785/01]
MNESPKSTSNPKNSENLSSSNFSWRLRTIRENLRGINRDTERNQGEHKNLMELHLEDAKLREEIAALVVLLPRIEKLLIKLEYDPLSRSLRFLRLSSKQIELRVLFEYIEIAIEVLSDKQPSIGVARKIRIDIERTVNRYEHPIMGFFINRFIDVYRSESEPLKVVSGLAFTSVIAAIFFFGSLVGLARNQKTELDQQIESIQGQLEEIENKLNESNIFITEEGKVVSGVQQQDDENIFGNVVGATIQSQELRELVEQFREETRQLSELRDIRTQQQQDNSILFLIILVVSSGTLGSVISILIRISDFEEPENPDPLIPIFMGAFKPIIGSSFGLLVFALFNSGIISLQILPSDNARGQEFFYSSLAFVIGFSERLAKDVIKRTENTLLGGYVPPSPSEQQMNHSQEVIEVKSDQKDKE